MSRLLAALFLALAIAACAHAPAPAPSPAYAPPPAAPVVEALTNGAGMTPYVTRADGARQWAYKGKPLYLWVKDQKPGDRTGDNVNNVWHVATP